MDNSNPSAEKSSKELREEKSRDSKLEEQVLKTLGPAANIEEKFNLLLRKFVENEKTCKKLNSTLKLNEKKYDTLLRERENLQKEYNKGVLMKDKLEQVCREQQKLIKSVKNESLTKIKEEEEKRKESQAKFQDSINEISVTLNKNNEENMKLKEDNIEMTKKLKFLAEQYQTREKQLQKISEQISLETQLNEAKLKKLQMEAAIEKEALLRDKQSALDELINCKKVIQEMQSREELLKEQLNVYTSKYDDFQVSLQKSNDIFVTYKAELEKVYKTNRKLEKECVEWKKKWERSNATLIELATGKQAKDEYITKITRQLNQLQKLLRALQAERNCLHQVLKDNNIERPPIPVLPPEPEISIQPPPPVIQSSDKVDQMVKNCAELKQTLSKLQNQVEAITEMENKKTKISKKSKSKGDKSNQKKISDNQNSEITTNTEQLSTVNSHATVDPLQNPSSSAPASDNQCDNESTIATENNQFNDSNNDLHLPDEQQTEDESHNETTLNRIEMIPDISNQENVENCIYSKANESSNAQDNLETTVEKIDEVLDSSAEINQIVADLSSKCEINKKVTESNLTV